MACSINPSGRDRLRISNYFAAQTSIVLSLSWRPSLKIPPRRQAREASPASVPVIILYLNGLTVQTSFYGTGNHGSGEGSPLCRRTPALQQRPRKPHEHVARAFRRARRYLVGPGT